MLIKYNKVKFKIPIMLIIGQSQRRQQTNQSRVQERAKYCYYIFSAHFFNHLEVYVRSTYYLSVNDHFCPFEYPSYSRVCILNFKIYTGPINCSIIHYPNCSNPELGEKAAVIVCTLYSLHSTHNWGRGLLKPVVPTFQSLY